MRPPRPFRLVPRVLVLGRNSPAVASRGLRRDTLSSEEPSLCLSRMRRVVYPILVSLAQELAPAARERQELRSGSPTTISVSAVRRWHQGNTPDDRHQTAQAAPGRLPRKEYAGPERRLSSRNPRPEVISGICSGPPTAGGSRTSRGVKPPWGTSLSGSSSFRRPRDYRRVAGGPLFSETSLADSQGFRLNATLVAGISLRPFEWPRSLALKKSLRTSRKSASYQFQNCLNHKIGTHLAAPDFSRGG